jgi:hypothetical protein
MNAIGFRDLWRHRYPDGREFSGTAAAATAFASRSRIPLARPCGAGLPVRYSREERRSGPSGYLVLLLDLPRPRGGAGSCCADPARAEELSGSMPIGR